uniref:Uncharacterized protein n=1 Tax=Oryza barthii TaxID=65489 RepID=A0A0D3H4T0_9ORYZ
MPPSPRFSFGQIWRGGRRVLEWRGPGPALRGGGSMKSADGLASVRCGGCCVLPYVCVGVSELVDGDLQSRVKGLRQKPSPVVHRAGSGYTFGHRNLLGALSRVTLSLARRATLGENHIFLDGR